MCVCVCVCICMGMYAYEHICVFFGRVSSVQVGMLLLSSVCGFVCRLVCLSACTGVHMSICMVMNMHICTALPTCMRFWIGSFMLTVNVHVCACGHTDLHACAAVMCVNRSIWLLSVFGRVASWQAAVMAEIEGSPSNIDLAPMLMTLSRSKKDEIGEAVIACL